MEKFCILSDFEKTLTKVWQNNEKILSPTKILRNKNYLNEDYKKEAHNLYLKYSPYEKHSDLDLGKRKKMNQEWWEKHRDLFIKHQIKKDLITKVNDDYPRIWREGIEEFFNLIKKYNLDLFIITAGLASFLKEALKRSGFLSDTVYILGNLFKFDEKGVLIAYEDEIIHTLNKDQAFDLRPKYKSIIDKYDNALLLGDKIEDLQMGKVKNWQNLIKILFYNHKNFALLEEFKNKADVVILNDADFAFVNYLINFLKEK